MLYLNLIVALVLESILRVKRLIPTVGTRHESCSKEGSHKAESRKLFPADVAPTQMTIEYFGGQPLSAP